jgi:predicted transposase YbfD/YdcC
MVRRQLQIPAKTNEIPALKDLLADLNLRGPLVSLDALPTQKETARFLVQDQQADDLLPVKANQPKLFNKLTRLARTGAVFPSGHHLEPGPRPA